MPKIIRYPETLLSRERVLRTFAFTPVDRVPINYSANYDIHSRLAAALGVEEHGDQRAKEPPGIRDYQHLEMTANEGFTRFIH